jgi:hypothetical protein
MFSQSPVIIAVKSINQLDITSWGGGHAVT